MSTLNRAIRAGFAAVAVIPMTAAIWDARDREGPDPYIDGGLTEALAKIYDSKGNTARAAELYRDFIELWKNADPELQPRVAAARARLRALETVEAKRP